MRLAVSSVEGGGRSSVSSSFVVFDLSAASGCPTSLFMLLVAVFNSSPTSSAFFSASMAEPDDGASRSVFIRLQIVCGVVGHARETVFIRTRISYVSLATPPP